MPRPSRMTFNLLCLVSPSPCLLIAVFFAVALNPREHDVYRLGVLDASVDARVSTATVRFQHQAQSAGELIRVVESLGFQVRLCVHFPYPIPTSLSHSRLPQHCSNRTATPSVRGLLAGYPPARLRAFQGVRAPTVFLVNGSVTSRVPAVEW